MLDITSEASYDSMDEIEDDQMFKIEISDLWDSCEQEIRKEIESIQKQKEHILETIADEKYERIAELKSHYKYELKGLDDPDLCSRIEKERDHKISVVKLELDERKSLLLKDMEKSQLEAQQSSKVKRSNIKKVLQKQKQRKLNRSNSFLFSSPSKESIGNLTRSTTGIKCFSPEESMLAHKTPLD